MDRPSIKQTLGRPYMSFRGLEHGPHELVDSVQDVVAGDLCEVHHGSRNRLIALLLLLVQQLLLWLVQGQAGPTPVVYSGLQPSIP